MTEFLVGLLLGVVIGWAVLHAMEVHFERRNP
jgi:hypothetical protein